MWVSQGLRVSSHNHAEGHLPNFVFWTLVVLMQVSQREGSSSDAMVDSGSGKQMIPNPSADLRSLPTCQGFGLPVEC